MSLKEAGSKIGAAKDMADPKKLQAEMSRQRYEAAKNRAEAAKKLAETRDVEYLRGQGGMADRFAAAKDRADQTAASVDQRKMELAQAQDLVKKIIERIEKGGK